MNSKTKRIARYLETHSKGITQMEAVEHFNAYRLSAIIFELKKQGYEITTELVNFKTQDGRTSKFARYKLVSSPKEREKK